MNRPYSDSPTPIPHPEQTYEEVCKQAPPRSFRENLLESLAQDRARLEKALANAEEIERIIQSNPSIIDALEKLTKLGLRLG